MSKKAKHQTRFGDMKHVQRRPGFDDDYRGFETSEIPQSDLALENLRAEDPEKARRFRRLADEKSPLISHKPHVEAVLGNPLVVLHLQLDLLRAKAVEKAIRGEMLDYDDERRLHKLIESVTRLTREIRTQEQHEAIEEMDRDELKAQLRLAQDTLFGEEGEK